MNIAIIGRSEILYQTTELLVKNGYRIKLIVTAKEAPEYLKTSEDFEELSVKHGAKYLCTSRINDMESIDVIKSAGLIDMGISMNWVNIISKKVIDLFPYGSLNAHGGDLPRYRGNACQAWAIINGEERVGLCIHKMIGGELDSGDIISRDYIDININTKIEDIYKWMSEKIPQLFLDAVRKLQNNKDFVLQKQSKNAKDILRCYPRIPEDGKVDWGKSNIEILRLINASGRPYSGAFCEYLGEKMIIWDAELCEDQENVSAVPGQIKYIDKESGYVVVITGRGKIKLKEIEYCGFKGSPMNHVKFIRKRLT